LKKTFKQYLTYICATCCLITTLTCSIYSLKHIRQQYITDKLGITSIPIKKIITPHSIQELQNIVRNTHEPIAIAGGCYSQGGQIAYPDGIVISMKKLNNIIEFDKQHKTITVQAGATWYDIQCFIDPYNLSMSSMQSYNNFTLGGSLSVNVHGRDIHHCQLINTVQSIEMILADGSLITASRTHNTDLFAAAIGGYGLLGIITQATLTLTDNIPLERKIQPCTLENFSNVFFDKVAPDPSTVLYKTDIFPKQYQKCLTTTWHTTTQPLTTIQRLQSKNSPFYVFDRALEVIVRRVPFTKNLRPIVQELKHIKPSVVWRNYEMSYSVHQLAIHTHTPTTMTLQEYFIPIRHAQKFAQKLRSILKKHWVNVLNISIRYIKPDTTCLMSYAPQESFSFVLYLNIFNFQKSIAQSCKWTQKIIDAALKNGGSFYLPYIMCATPKQFHQAYPQFKKLLEVKKIYDPENKFRNMLLQKYGESI
jgi:FAD/FMN-containing dehydrogenase